MLQTWQIGVEVSVITKAFFGLGDDTSLDDKFYVTIFVMWQFRDNSI